MPIRPELRHHYGVAWKAIRAKILERAGHCCERCRLPNYAEVARKPCGCAWIDDGEFRGPDCPETHPLRGDYPEKVVKIVLTIAHLNHVAGDNREENLAALCQRCHLRLDRDQHAASARATRNRRRGVQDLFPEVPHA